MAAPSGSAIRALGLEYKSLCEDPVEGFRVKLANEEDMFCGRLRYSDHQTHFIKVDISRPT